MRSSTALSLSLSLSSYFISSISIDWCNESLWSFHQRSSLTSWTHPDFVLCYLSLRLHQSHHKSFWACFSPFKYNRKHPHHLLGPKALLPVFLYYFMNHWSPLITPMPIITPEISWFWPKSTLKEHNTHVDTRCPSCFLFFITRDDCQFFHPPRLISWWKLPDKSNTAFWQYNNLLKCWFFTGVMVSWVSTCQICMFQFSKIFQTVMNNYPFSTISIFPYLHICKNYWR